MRGVLKVKLIQSLKNSNIHWLRIMENQYGHLCIVSQAEPIIHIKTMNKNYWIVQCYIVYA